MLIARMAYKLQVTRLKCSGFIFAFHLNHTIADGIGISRFMKALAEIACGAPKPSIPPVWRSYLQCARDPPRVTCNHLEYQQELVPPDTNCTTKPHHRSFFFGPTELAAIRHLLPHQLAQYSTSFEVLTACLWCCRTAELYWQNPDEEVRWLCIVSAGYGHCRFNPPPRDGFYGNALVFLAAVTTTRKLCGRPLAYALELLKKPKGAATEEYVHSVADLLVIKGRPYFIREGSFMVSDLTKAGHRDVHFGWRKAVYAGVPNGGGLGGFHGLSFYVPFTNAKREEGRVVLMCLPAEAMERFVKELDDTLKIKNPINISV